MRAWLAGAAFAAAAIPVTALSCGVCAEDKIAATYDHAIVTRAATQGRIVVFAALDGPAEASVLAAAAARAARHVGAIDASTVRVAASPSALAFVLDPRRATPAAALASVERNARVRGMRVTLLRVLD
jgi:hypothetical protein